MRPRVISHHGGAFEVGKDFYQSDWDFPSAAARVGWSLRRVQKRKGRTVELQAVRPGRQNCDHDATDGTVTCRACGVTATEFITGAANYLERMAS